jgi:transposase
MKHAREFRDGAVRIVEEAGKPIAQIARDLGVNEARSARLGVDVGAVTNELDARTCSGEVPLHLVRQRLRPDTVRNSNILDRF